MKRVIKMHGYVSSLPVLFRYCTHEILEVVRLYYYVRINIERYTYHCRRC